MFYFALIISIVMLLGVSCAFLRSKQPVPISLAWMVVPGVFALVLFSQPVLEFGVVVLVLVLTTNSLNRRWLFVPLSILAFAIVFGINSAIAWSEVRRFQARYPFESIEERLPARPIAEAKLSAKVESQVSYWERSRVFGFNVNYREIHENAVGVFINRPNFGVARMSGVLGLGVGLNSKESIPQPGSRSVSASVSEEVGKAIPIEEDLEGLHHNSTIFDFLSLSQFGYVKDRRHVAGFPSHQFRSVPKAKLWKLETLDLVGLVVHDKPVVYISENLPRMDELRKAPLRELDAFESAGLKVLREGEDLFVREMPDSSVRMLGSLRAMKQCIDCHGGARGDLLGAFSYELRRE